MHGIGSIFEVDGRRIRVLYPAKTSEGAPLYGELWCIDVNDPKAWPTLYSVEETSKHPASEFEFDIRHDLTPKEVELKDKAWNILGRLINESLDHLFDPSLRKAAISRFVATLKAEAMVAKKLGHESQTCTEPTLYKWLRRYWQRGKRPAALAPDYPKCGKVVDQAGDTPAKSFTANRGRPSSRGVPIFQLQPKDRENFRWAIQTYRGGDERLSLYDTYVRLIRERYSYKDGNDVRFDLPEGERPSLKQIRSYYLANYPHDVRVKHRVGTRERNLNWRAKTGSAITISHGPGHQFEVDATPIECYAVTRTNRRRIVGKPTLYLVIDRWSRLIVGYYLGFEHPSWIAAMQAILSLAEDKEQLCRRYGVKYDASDWPAHGYFPEEFKADRGSDWTSNNSRKIVENLGPTVENLPAGRAEMKPIVENGINLILRKYRKFEKSSDPDANQRKRQKKHYKRLASASIDLLNKFTLEAIINLNKTQYTEFPMDNDMVAAEMRPMPTQLWAYGVAKTGLPRHYSEKVVRRALLPGGTASVNEHGIHLGHLTYWAQEAEEAKWFDIGYGNTFPVKTSFDPRNVDRIYVFWPNDPNGEAFVATLSERSSEYSGLSLNEVEALERIKSRMRGRAAAENLQEETNFLDRVEPAAEKAFKEMKQETKGASMASRTKNAAEDWQIALQEERREKFLVTEATDTPAPTPPALGLRVVSSAPPKQDQPERTPSASTPVAGVRKNLSMAERVAAMKDKFFNPEGAK